MGLFSECSSFMCRPPEGSFCGRFRTICTAALRPRATAAPPPDLEANRPETPPAADNGDGLIKSSSKLALTMLGVSFSGLAGVLSANLGRKTATTTILLKLLSGFLMVLLLCSMGILCLDFLRPKIRGFRTVLKLLCILAWVLLLASTVFAFVVVMHVV